MSHHETGWEPKGVTTTFDGFDVYDHGVHANEINEAVVDGDLDLTGED